MTVYYLLIHTTEHIYTHMGSMITPGHSLCIVRLYFSMEIKNCGVNSYHNFSTAKKNGIFEIWGSQVTLGQIYKMVYKVCVA